MRIFKKKAISIFVLICFVISGCSTMSTISSAQPDVSLTVKNKTYPSLPTQDRFGATTFGNYEFLAEKEGYDPLYGELPMNLSVGNLVLDILFFTPLMLFNLYEVFPYYVIDMEQQLVQYSFDNTQWYKLAIPAKESERAKKYFNKANIHPQKDKAAGDVKANQDITTIDTSTTSSLAGTYDSADSSDAASELRDKMINADFEQ